MLRAWLSEYREHVWRRLRAAFEEEHAAHDVAASFGIGAFVTVLPTLGTGLLLFPVFTYVSNRVSMLALLASVAVFNPVMKWGVYAASFWLGTHMLGPLPRSEVTNLSLSAGPDVVARLLAGNVVFAVLFSILGYVVVLRLVRAYRKRGVELADLLPGDGTNRWI